MRELHWHPTENEWGFYLFVPSSRIEGVFLLMGCTTGKGLRV